MGGGGSGVFEAVLELGGKGRLGLDLEGSHIRPAGRDRSTKNVPSEIRAP